METRILKRRRFTPAALVAGAAGSLFLALGLGVSLSAYTATINNTTNTAASKTLAITETSGAATCNSFDATATCSTINKYGGTATALAPGESRTVTVTFNNVGNSDVATSTLTPSACVATTVGGVGSTIPATPNTAAGNLCSQLRVAVYKGATTTTPIFTGAPSAFTAAVDLGTLSAGSSQAYNFVVSLPASAPNTIQGQQVSQPLLWTFNQ